MTETMEQAGIKAYLDNKDKEPGILINVVWQAIKDAKQKEALELYWREYE